MKKYTFKHTTGDRIPIDDAMIELRNRMLPAFGYVIRDVCSLRLANPNAKHATFRCVEKEALDTTWSDNGALCSSFHAVYVDTKSGDG